MFTKKAERTTLVRSTAQYRVSNTNKNSSRTTSQVRETKATPSTKINLPDHISPHQKIAHAGSTKTPITGITKSKINIAISKGIASMLLGKPVIAELPLSSKSTSKSNIVMPKKRDSVTTKGGKTNLSIPKICTESSQSSKTDCNLVMPNAESKTSQKITTVAPKSGTDSSKQTTSVALKIDSESSNDTAPVTSNVGNSQMWTDNFQETSTIASPMIVDLSSAFVPSTRKRSVTEIPVDVKIVRRTSFLEDINERVSTIPGPSQNGLKDRVRFGKIFMI